MKMTCNQGSYTPSIVSMMTEFMSSCPYFVHTVFRVFHCGDGAEPRSSHSLCQACCKPLGRDQTGTRKVTMVSAGRVMPWKLWVTRSSFGAKISWSRRFQSLVEIANSKIYDEQLPNKRDTARELLWSGQVEWPALDSGLFLVGFQ